eukprot:TRINITY_DN93947_c0_g1_i1.p1 TRINITY_DN93947_c0_g1~~TRINITY_DN93947_c0_g1_i1.p1  ORF type:complete len:280 (-),score=49.26 TRINITY_DN93947_c0_g1_i1:76-915(-)
MARRGPRLPEWHGARSHLERMLIKAIACTAVLVAVLCSSCAHLAVAFAQPQAAVDALHKAVARGDATKSRPDEAEVLKAILYLQKKKGALNSESPFLQYLTGNGVSGGKRWRLVYLANKNAVVAERKGQAPPGFFDRGWYVDGFVTAVQRFEQNRERTINQNGVFGFLGLAGFFFGYFARFKWPSPEKRATLAFQPVTNNLSAFGQNWAWPFAGSKEGPEGDKEFDAARLQSLNIFNFLYADDDVAVAQGASGSVALWGSTDPAWEKDMLISVPEGSSA